MSTMHLQQWGWNDVSFLTRYGSDDPDESHGRRY